jgi:hypothetical protein
MDFPFTGIHHPEVALAVHNLSSQRNGTEIDSGSLNIRNTSHGHCTRHDFDQSFMIPVNKFAPQFDSFACESSNFLVCPVLA